MKWIWCVSWCGVVALGLWHCGGTAPNSSPRTKYCLDNGDCALGRSCIKGTCSINTPGDNSILTSMPDGPPPEDLDNQEGPKADRATDQPSMISADHGRSADATPSETHLETEPLPGDPASGRAADATPGTPTPRREPPGTSDKGDDKDNTKSPPGSICKDGETRSCYPEGTKGCASKDGVTYHCIAPCAAGQETCKENAWGSCQGARTPANDKECVQALPPATCPDGTPKANGRCI